MVYSLNLSIPFAHNSVCSAQISFLSFAPVFSLSTLVHRDITMLLAVIHSFVPSFPKWILLQAATLLLLLICHHRLYLYAHPVQSSAIFIWLTVVEKWPRRSIPYTVPEWNKKKLWEIYKHTQICTLRKKIRSRTKTDCRWNNGEEKNWNTIIICCKMGGMVKFVHISQRWFFSSENFFSHGYKNVEFSLQYFILYIAAVESSTAKENHQWKKNCSRKSFVFWPVIYRTVISCSHSGLACCIQSTEMRSPRNSW